MKPFVALPLVLLLALPGAWAQQGEGKLSDAERARRDADKVFNFIKFHTVKPAAPAAPAPAARPPVPAATSRSLPLSSAAAAAAAKPTVPAATAAPAAPVTTASPAAEVQQAANPPPEPLASPVPAAAASLPPVAQPVAAPQPEEEVPLRLIAYTPPDMSGSVMAAMPSNQIIVPVRFIVQPDGKVSSAQAMGNAPRKVANAAVRAVQQWRFEPIPAVREVDVEISFKVE